MSIWRMKSTPYFAGRLALIAFWVLAWSPEAKAEGPCDAFTGGPVQSCEQRLVDIFRVQFDGVEIVASKTIPLNPTRMYWACCAAGLNGAPPTWTTSTFFVVTRPAGTVTGPIEHCKHEIASSISSAASEAGVDAIWAEGNSELHALVLGTAVTTQASSFQFCSGDFVAVPDDSVRVGGVWIASVVADELEEDD